MTVALVPTASPDASGYAAGQVLGDRYELTGPIGRGGTAVVWVARDSVLQIDVAVKIVLPCTDDIYGTLKRRTIQEARLCAQLTDPAVCRVLDFGFTHRGDPFVVSELLNGETLDDRFVREGWLPAADAVRLLLPILDALGAAHKRGIVHRDVKPANVFLAGRDGRVQPKLLDFGIARSLDAQSRTTTTGTICGTPCYMSPEQARGSSDVDLRTDIWSFCVMLYELVTGAAPFLSENYNATLFAISNAEAPPMATFGCDERLAQIVERGMQKDRDARWSSTAELASELARWLTEQGFESDVCGLSLQRRVLESTTAPLQPPDAAFDLASERAVSFSPPQQVSPPQQRGSEGAVEHPTQAFRLPATRSNAVPIGALAVAIAFWGVAVLARNDPRPAAEPNAVARTVSASQPARAHVVPADPVQHNAALQGTEPAARVPPLPDQSVAHPAPKTTFTAAPRTPLPAPRVSTPLSALNRVHAPASIPPRPAPPLSTIPSASRQTPKRNALEYDFGI